VDVSTEDVNEERADVIRGDPEDGGIRPKAEKTGGW
jgi:hypothetical protein